MMAPCPTERRRRVQRTEPRGGYRHVRLRRWTRRGQRVALSLSRKQAGSVRLRPNAGGASTHCPRRTADRPGPQHIASGKLPRESEELVARLGRCGRGPPALRGRVRMRPTGAGAAEISCVRLVGRAPNARLIGDGTRKHYHREMGSTPYLLPQNCR